MKILCDVSVHKIEIFENFPSLNKIDFQCFLGFFIITELTSINSLARF